MGWRDSLRHAFAVDKPEDFRPTEAQQEVIDQLCREIVRRHMTTPAQVVLEVSQPLNFLGSQCLHFLRPAASAIFDTRKYQVFAELLEHRGSIGYISARLDHFGRERSVRLGRAHREHDTEPPAEEADEHDQSR